MNERASEARAHTGATPPAELLGSPSAPAASPASRTAPDGGPAPPGHPARRGRVCVVGLGYIGLPTSAVLASRGFEVHGVDLNPEAREVINSGRAHIVEPDLDMLVQAGIRSGRLRAHAEPAPAEVFMLCVPTPVDESHGADLAFVESATRDIAPFLLPGNLVVLESTSPPGTTERIASLVAEERPDLEPGAVHFAHAPERVLPGRILEEVIHNDRIIGGIDRASTEAACAFFGSFVSGELIRTTSRTAEMSKLVENASRDAQIAFANEVSMLCEEQGIDARELIRIANHHPRVNILEPGCGVGGHCIAVDPWFLVHMAPERARLIRTAREVNDAKPEWVVERAIAAAREHSARNGGEPAVVACLGATYKPDIDDLRESPALAIAHALEHRPEVGRTLVVEPNVESIEGVEQVELAEALARADVLLCLVAHRAFAELRGHDLSRHAVLDVCGLFPHERRRSPGPSHGGGATP